MLKSEQVEEIAKREIKKRYSGKWYSQNFFVGKPKEKHVLHIWQVPLGYTMKDDVTRGKGSCVNGDIGVSLLIDGLDGKVLYAPPHKEVDRIIKTYEERKREVLSPLVPIVSSTD